MNIDLDSSAGASYILTGRQYGARRPADVLSHPMGAKAEQMVFKFMRNTTTGGAIDMSVNATSTAAQTFFVKNETTTAMHLVRMNWKLQDGGILAVDFGGITNGITNGLKVTLQDTNGSELYDFLDGETIKNNGDFVFLAGTDVDRDTDGAGDDVMGIRWTIEKAGGPVVLAQNQSLQITIQDDLSAITSFKAMLQGYYLPEWY